MKRRLAVAGLSLVVAMGTVALPAVTTARAAAGRGTTAAAADPKPVDRAVAAADKVTSSGFDALAKGPDERPLGRAGTKRRSELDTSGPAG